MSGGLESHYSDLIDQRDREQHDRDARNACLTGMTVPKYLVAKQVERVFNEYKSALPFSFVLNMQRELEALMRKGE